MRDDGIVESTICVMFCPASQACSSDYCGEKTKLGITNIVVLQFYFGGNNRDVCGQVELTPMAIAAGRRLADRLFSHNKPEHEFIKVSYEMVPTVVFSHPVSSSGVDVKSVS